MKANIKILRNSLLQPGTVMLSDDMYDGLKQAQNVSPIVCVAYMNTTGKGDCQICGHSLGAHKAFIRSTTGGNDETN